MTQEQIIKTLRDLQAIWRIDDRNPWDRDAEYQDGKLQGYALAASDIDDLIRDIEK